MDPLLDTVEFNLSKEDDKLFAKHFGPSMPRSKLTFGALSHKGKMRTNNEDHFSVVQRYRGRKVLFTNVPEEFTPQTADESYTMVVADGLGGCAFGEMASMIAIRTGWEMSGNAFNWHFQAGEQATEDLMEQLKVYGKRMHRALVEQARANPQLAGMGSTITGGMVIGTDAFIGHVGDSRAYLLHDGALKQKTSDHTQAQQLVDAGVYASIAETPRSMRHTLVNCLGGNHEDVQVDTLHIPLAHGDRLLLCTDGLSEMVSDVEIALILKQVPKPEEACQALVDAALEHGGRDNVTVVLAAVEVVSERE